jgi:hypothetical protein
LKVSRGGVPGSWFRVQLFAGGFVMEHPFAPISEVTVGSFRYDIGEDCWTWSSELYQRRGLDPGRVEPSTDLFFLRMVEEDQPAVKAAIVTASQQVGAFSTRYRIDTPTGGRQSILMAGESVADGDQIGQLRGFTLDITGLLNEAGNDAVWASAQHRAAIEQVKGALMLACDVDENEAFAILRTWSQHLNEKLSHLAERVARDLAATRIENDTPRRTLLQLFQPDEPDDETLDRRQLP